MTERRSRYETISRRAFLQRSAAIGMAAVVPGVILSACGTDAKTLATAAATTSTTSTLPGAAETTTEAVAGPTLSDGAELVVDFSYEAATDGRGGAKNPYVAVWVEDESGELVATIALWFLQSQKGTKWLSDLRRWSTVDGSTVTVNTISGATRPPGTYSVVWDGTTIDGIRATQGNYYLAIEAAREHGPYSLIREPIAIGTGAFNLDLGSNGELTDASASLVLA